MGLSLCPLGKFADPLLLLALYHLRDCHKMASLTACIPMIYIGILQEKLSGLRYFRIEERTSGVIRLFTVPKRGSHAPDSEPVCTTVEYRPSRPYVVLRR
jgi:hypothetical protein